MIGIVAQREIRAMFRTPFAWAVLAAVQLLIAYQFLAQIDLFLQYLPKIRNLPEPPGVTQLIVLPTFSVTGLLALFLIPLLTMQTFAGERRAATLSLWLSAPVSLPALVIGKFLGAMSLLGIIWGLNALMALTLLWGTSLDLGLVACGLLGLLLLMAAGTALGIWFSALTTQPALAAITTFATLAGLWLIDWASGAQTTPGLFAELSMMRHFQRLAGGLLDTVDVVYFGLITAGALALAVRALADTRSAA